MLRLELYENMIQNEYQNFKQNSNKPYFRFSESNLKKFEKYKKMFRINSKKVFEQI